jgi:hypothetical protein
VSSCLSLSEVSLSLSLAAKRGDPHLPHAPIIKKKKNSPKEMQCLWLYADCRPVRKSMGQPAKHGIGLQFECHRPQRPMPPSSSPLSTSSHAGAMAKGRGAVRGCRLGGNWQREERKGASMLYREPQCCCAFVGIGIGIGTLMVEVEGKLWLTDTVYG